MCRIPEEKMEEVRRLEMAPTISERLKVKHQRDFEFDRLLVALIVTLVLMFTIKGCFVQPPKIPAPTITPAQTAVVPKEVSPPAVDHTPAPARTAVMPKEVPPPAVDHTPAPVPLVEYELWVEATAYWTHDPVDASGHGIAYDGTPAIAYKTIAVDPKVIPLNSQVYIQGFGWLRANDTGNAIKGAIIDIAMPSREAAWEWGRRKILVKVRPPKGSV